MMSKIQLRQRFSNDPSRYYHVRLFDELGFVRKRCKCGKYFWTLNSEQEKCPNPPCTNYGFIGNSPAKAKLDYVDAWKAIEKFFVKNGHKSIESYPTVCRWFPGLFFNIASITSFQRSVAGKTVFEFPANPLIIPQTCLRFPDIENVGVSGRHHTSFIMIGQHSIYDEVKKEGYWKDRCIELDWKLMTDVFKIPDNEISFIEDVWVGPNAFGYSLEYFVRGLELGNAVFTEFLGTPDNFTTMKNKIIDMGAGHERFVWLMSGMPTSYDSAFGPVARKLKGLVEYDERLFLKYAQISGNLNLDEISDIGGAKAAVAEKLGISHHKLIENTEKLEAVYAVADHAKTLLYAITDGQLPSNVGGGYNLRVILRRALDFINKFGLDIDLFEVCKMHAQYLKQMNKRLVLGLDELKEIIDVETKRFNETRNRGFKMVENIFDRKVTVDEKKFVELYESHGITPETINQIAKARHIDVSIPPNLYAKISEKHMGERKNEATERDLPQLPETRLLFYEKQNQREFSANVISIIDSKIVVLDKTCFYARSGGQEPDLGTINGCRVYDVEKAGGVVLHFVENINFNHGDIVDCVVDEGRRKQLTQHHTATHIVNAAAVKLFGNHVWQHSAYKDVDRAKLDITHYELLDEKALVELEVFANKMVDQSVRIKKIILPRTEAEQKYGFRIYQGGAVPEKELRIVEIDGMNVQSCGGLHCDNTKDVEEIIILKQERIQDGVIRLIFAAGDAARKEKEKQAAILVECEKILSTDGSLLDETKCLVQKWKSLRKVMEKRLEEDAKNVIKNIEKMFVKNVLVERVDADAKELQAISKEMSGDEKVVVLFGIAGNKIFVFGSAGAKTDINIGEIVREACIELGGSGGGSQNLAQGVGMCTDKLNLIIDKIRKRLIT